MFCYCTSSWGSLSQERRDANGFSFGSDCLASLAWELFWVQFSSRLDEDEIIFSFPQEILADQIAGSIRLAYLATNISNLNCSTSSVLVWTEMSREIHMRDTEKWLGFFWIFIFFFINLPLYRLSQQHYSWPLTADSWAFKTANTLNKIFYILWLFSIICEVLLDNS